MAINNNCVTKQTFCALGKQTVSQNDSLVFDYPKNLSNSTIDKDIWNEIIKEIILIYNYGDRGTRNPINVLNIDNFSEISDNHIGNETKNSAIISNTEEDKHKVKKEQIILQDDYNLILSSLSATPIENLNKIIFKEDFENLKIIINNFLLDDSRCNNCNVACNITCEAENQCYCDCYCYCDSGVCGSHSECAPCSICYNP